MIERHPLLFAGALDLEGDFAVVGVDARGHDAVLGKVLVFFEKV